MTDSVFRRPQLPFAREAVVAGKCHGPADLADECDELHQDEHGNWKGRKDLLMAIGFALRLCRRSPYIPPRPVVDPERVIDAQAIIRNLRKPRDGGW